VDEIFSSIIGNEIVKNSVRELQTMIDKARQEGKADPFKFIPRNFLFLGPPGTG
jgi:AAA+ superfamily predicted ATPase